MGKRKKRHSGQAVKCLEWIILSSRAGVSNSFSLGATSAVAFQGLNVVLGLYKCNYSFTVKRELGAAAG